MSKSRKGVLAHELKRLREEEHLSNSEIADRYEISESYVYQLIGKSGLRRQRRATPMKHTDCIEPNVIKETIPIVVPADNPRESHLYSSVGAAMNAAVREKECCENCVHYRTTDVECSHCCRNLYLGDFYVSKNKKVGRV